VLAHVIKFVAVPDENDGGLKRLVWATFSVV